MPFKTPAYWYQPQQDIKAKILRPIAAIYGAINGARMKKRPSYASAQAKVVCIGNLTAGGGGKTPTAIAISQLLGRDHSVFLTRGYGRKSNQADIVTTDHSVDDAGDEALLLARHRPTIISADRINGAKLAEQHGAKLIIMDDGLQNPYLYKDLRLCVIDGPRGFGNMHCIPAGPLRQPLEIGLTQVDAFIIIGDTIQSTMRLLPKSLPVFKAQLVPQIDKLPENFRTIPYTAFCGIAQPEKFKESLKEIGIKTLSVEPFADHYNFTVAELQNLYNKAKAQGGRLITTEKDFVRIPDGPWKDLLDVLPVILDFEDALAVKQFIDQHLSSDV